MQGSILGRPVYYRIGIGERIAAEQIHCSFQGRVGPKINSWLLLATAAVVFVKYMQLVKKKDELSSITHTSYSLVLSDNAHGHACTCRVYTKKYNALAFG